MVDVNERIIEIYGASEGNAFEVCSNHVMKKYLEKMVGNMTLDIGLM